MKKECLLICLLLFAISLYINAQPNHRSSKKKDSLLIERLINKTNLQLVTDELTNEEKKNKKMVDSLLGAFHTGYSDGVATYAPDNAFKIIVIEGENGGAYAYPVYAAFISTRGRNIPTPDILFFPVEHIYKLGKADYLIMHEAAGIGGGIHSYNTRSATLIKVQNNRIIYSPVTYGNSNIPHEQGTVRVDQNQFLSDEEDWSKMLKLNFDIQTNKLTYSYLEKEFDTEKIYLYKGFFKYVNSSLIIQQASKTRFKTPTSQTP